MNRLNTLSTLLAGGALLLGGCGGGDTFSEEDTATAQTAVQQVISEAVGAASAGGLSAAQDGGNVSVDYTYDCMGGGTVHVAGEYSGVSNGVGGAQAYTNVDAAFSTCGASVQGKDLTMDGNLKYVTGINATGGMVASFEFVMDGSITFGGGITGTCEYDVNISGNQSGGEASGSICGNDFSGNY